MCYVRCDNNMCVLLETYPVTAWGIVQVSRVLQIVVIHVTTFVVTDYFKQRTVLSSYTHSD
jgi:hypothetical protein